MAITFVTSTVAGSANQNNVTTSGINTTGANLIVLACAYQSGTPSVSDSKSNTWTARTEHKAGGFFPSRIYYCLNPTVGSGHTFTLTATTGIPTVAAFAFSGVDSFDQESDGGGAFATTCDPGTITPNFSNDLFVTALTAGFHGTAPTISGSFTAATLGQTANNTAGGGAYKIQTGVASDEDPNWTQQGTEWSSTTMAAFAATSPIITSNGGGSTASINIEENTTAVTTVTAFTTSTVSFTIGGGIDQDRFELDGETGVLSFVAGQFEHGAPDFEHPVDDDGNNIYEVEVHADDGTPSDSQLISVHVIDVPESKPSAAHFVVTRRKYNEENQ